MKYCVYILFLILSKVITAQELINYSLSSCDSKSYPEYIRNRLIDKEIKEDTLFLNVGLVLNCCPSLNPKLTYRNDTLFMQIIDNSEIWCACECCFEMQMKVTGIPDTNFTFVHQIATTELTNEGYKGSIEYQELKKLKNKYIFPELQEIESKTEFNQTNRDGLKIGVWTRYFEKSKKIHFKIFYDIDQNGNSIVLWEVEYDREGEIIIVCARTGKNIETCTQNYNQIMKNKP